MLDDQEAVQQLEGQGGYRKKVERDNQLAMVGEECLPALIRLSVSGPQAFDLVWTRNIKPKLKPIGLAWATFQVMRRSYATWSRKVGVDAHTRSAQMGNTVDVNENEYAVATFDQKLAAVRLLETAVVQ
jgi:hypothetical protein